MHIWHNGNWHDETTPLFSASERGLLLGDGVFTTLRAKDGTPEYAADHIARLVRHAAILGIALPVPQGDLENTLAAILTRNALTQGTTALRITLTRGPGPRGLLPPDPATPSLFVQAAALDTTSFDRPLTAIVAQSVRRNEGSPLSRIKSTNYGDAILARREAASIGAMEAILLNNRGNLTCTTIGNLVLHRTDDTWATPILSDGVMDGLTRARLLHERHITEQSLTTEDLTAAKAVYICNSLMGLRPLTLLGS